MVIFQALHRYRRLKYRHFVDKLWNKPELSGDSETQDVVFLRCEKNSAIRHNVCSNWFNQFIISH
jgi:hypothetical protein